MCGGGRVRGGVCGGQVRLEFLGNALVAAVALVTAAQAAAAAAAAEAAAGGEGAAGGGGGGWGAVGGETRPLKRTRRRSEPGERGACVGARGLYVSFLLSTTR